MDKHYPDDQSNYDLRSAYLKTLKQFMDVGLGMSSGQAHKEIDAYFGYEKQFSFQLQDALAHLKTRPATD